MKKLFLLLPFLIALSGQAQSLQGWFLTADEEQGFNSDLFHFDGNRFFYRNSGCLGTTTGQGTFALIHGHLMLCVEDSPADTVGIHASFPCPSPTTTPTFCFRVIKKTGGAALPGVSIISRKTGAGASTNLSGEAGFSYEPPPNDVLTVRSIGYGTVEVPLLSATSQGFVVKLGPPYYFSAGDTLIFQLKKKRRHSFAARPRLDNADIDDEKLPYTNCRRISDGEAKMLIDLTK